MEKDINLHEIAKAIVVFQKCKEPSNLLSTLRGLLRKRVNGIETLHTHTTLFCQTEGPKRTGKYKKEETGETNTAFEFS